MHIDPYQQDEVLFEATRRDGKPRVQVVRPQKTQVVLGRGSDVEKELYLQACLEDEVPIFRRSGGGCTVVLDPGNLIVLISLHAPGISGNLVYLRRLSDCLIQGLSRQGVEGVRQAGISDLVLGGRKVAGSCLYRAKDTLLYSASLLVAPDIDRIERYLRHPPREPDYRKGRHHREFLGSLLPGVAELDPDRLAGLLGEEILQLFLSKIQC